MKAGFSSIKCRLLKKLIISNQVAPKAMVKNSIAYKLLILRGYKWLDVQPLPSLYASYKHIKNALVLVVEVQSCKLSHNK